MENRKARQLKENTTGEGDPVERIKAGMNTDLRADPTSGMETIRDCFHIWRCPGRLELSHRLARPPHGHHSARRVRRVGRVRRVRRGGSARRADGSAAGTASRPGSGPAAPPARPPPPPPAAWAGAAVTARWGRSRAAHRTRPGGRWSAGTALVRRGQGTSRDQSHDLG